MASIDKIDSILDKAAVSAELKFLETEIKQAVEAIKAAKAQTVSFKIDTKSISDLAKSNAALAASLTKMNAATNDAVKSSVALAKQREAEAKAATALAKQMEAETKARAAATKETERQAAAAKKAAEQKRKEASPYHQLALAFAAAAREAQDLAAQYGVMDKRAQAAAKRANELNNKLKEIDTTVGINNRRVGSYSEGLDGFAGKLKNAALNFAALIGVAGAGSIFKDSINEFIEMDKNVRLLQNTLRNIGVPEAFARIEKSAKNLAKQFTFLDDDEILKSFNQLIVYGKLTEDQINELIPVIINFATATGQDLGSATSTIIKALEGNGKALKEYGINIKDAKNTTEAFSLIMTQLAPKVDGVGKAFGESAAGGLASASQEFKNLKEELGQGLLPLLNGVLSILLKITQGAIGAGKALRDAFIGDKTFVASILEGSDNADIAFEAEQVYQLQIAGLKSFQKVLKERQAQGKQLNVTEAEITKEYVESLKKQLAAREQQYASIAKTTNKEAIMSAIADLRGLRKAIDELDEPTKTITGAGADKNFKEGTEKIKSDAEERRKALFDILKSDLELEKELQKTRIDNEEIGLNNRLKAVLNFGLAQRALIEAQADFELGAARLTREERLRIENDKNNEIVRLNFELAKQIKAVIGDAFKVDTTKVAEGVKGITGAYAKIAADIKKEMDVAGKAVIENQKKIRETIISLAKEVEGLFFDIFTNGIENEKNAVQDLIDKLEEQKQKDIEVANQTITNANDRADAIAVIEARAAAERYQLELRQRQLEQQRARFEKARSITEIVQSTALAVANALTQVKLLGPGAIALAALIGALGAVQIARVIAQPIPRYAAGTENHPGGLAIVGDGGKPEGIRLPDGSLYKTPAVDTVVDLPAGSQVFSDYNDMPKLPSVTIHNDTRKIEAGLLDVKKAIQAIPQPIIHAEKAWTAAHKRGSSFTQYLNKRIN